MTNLYRLIDRCRSCGSDRFDLVLDLGMLAISDFVTDPTAPVDRAPLELVRCDACSLVQLTATINPNRLFGRDYGYRSGLNESMVAAMQDVAKDVMARASFKPDDVVLDIGASDGTLLRFFPDWLNRQGFEPAPALAPYTRDLVIYDEYFPPVRRFASGSVKAIVSCAQLYNVDDVNGYVAAVADMLAPDGLFVCQMMDLDGMLVHNAFDNVVHEHVTCFNSVAFSRLVERYGLAVFGHSQNLVNGGSVRIYVRHKPAGWESRFGHSYAETTYLPKFQQCVDLLRIQTMNLLHTLRNNGKRIAGLGASTKFSTLAQYYGLTPDLVECMGERNPAKVGKYIAGTGIPIVSEDEIRARDYDYLLLGPWHFLDAFRERERAFLERGGQFIVPLPQPRVVGLTEEARLKAAV